MKTTPNTPEEYIEQLPEDRKKIISRLRNVILTNIPQGFAEQISYGMLGYVVPLHTYPAGYHCNTKLPLPFINLASQKNFISLYHMGIYADNALMNWFVNAYAEQCSHKLDMGKSCVRFKKLDDIPYPVIGELCTKMTPTEWIKLYEKQLKKET